METLHLILCLMTALTDEQFTVREGATHCLITCGRVAEPFAKLGETSKDPELAYRCGLVTRGISVARFASLTSNWGKPWPWLDGVPPDQVTDEQRSSLICFWLNLSRELDGGDPSPDHRDYRVATKLYMLHLCENGYSEEKLLKILDQMLVKEKAWIREHRHRPVPEDQP